MIRHAFAEVYVARITLPLEGNNTGYNLFFLPDGGSTPLMVDLIRIPRSRLPFLKLEDHMWDDPLTYEYHLGDLAYFLAEQPQNWSAGETRELHEQAELAAKWGLENARSSWVQTHFSADLPLFYMVLVSVGPQNAYASYQKTGLYHHILDIKARVEKPARLIS